MVRGRKCTFSTSIFPLQTTLSPITSFKQRICARSRHARRVGHNMSPRQNFSWREIRKVMPQPTWPSHIFSCVCEGNVSLQQWDSCALECQLSLPKSANAPTSSRQQTTAESAWPDPQNLAPNFRRAVTFDGAPTLRELTDLSCSCFCFLNSRRLSPEET